MELLDFLLQQYSQPELGGDKSPWQKLIAEHGLEWAQAARQGIIDFAEFSRKVMLENPLSEISYSSGDQVLNFGLHQAAWPSNDPADTPSPVMQINNRGGRGTMAAAAAMPVTSMHDRPRPEPGAVLPL
jgi:hypothetical protein